MTDNPAPIRLLLVDDDPHTRESVRTMREAGIEIVAEAATGAEAEPLFRAHRPDVTLVKLHLPDTSAADLVTRLIAEAPKSRFIVLAAHDGHEDVDRALNAGAHSYIWKGAAGLDLVEAIRSAQAGQWQPPAVRPQGRAEHPSRRLSEREMQVLEMLAKGATNRDIASTLRISGSTVKAHVASILKKLGVNDRTEAAHQAIRRGLIPRRPGLDSRDRSR